MTEQTQPTDAEILDAADDFRSQYKHGGTTIDEFDALALDFARAVLAKWGTPAPVGVEPFAWTDDGSTRSGATATSHRVVTNETKKSMPAAAAVSFTVPLYTAEVLAVPLTDEQIDALDLPPSGTATVRDLVRIIEAAHGIKGGQHGADN